MARAIYFGGSRVMDAVNERLDWVIQKLGPSHPATKFLAITRFGPLARKHKIILPQAPRFKVFDPEPELALKNLQPIVDEPEATANVFGNIGSIGSSTSARPPRCSPDKSPWRGAYKSG
jgi:hypothetical protein